MKIVQCIVAATLVIGSPGAFAASEKQPAPGQVGEARKTPASKSTTDDKAEPGAAMKEVRNPKKSGARSSTKKSIQLNLCDQ